MIQLSNANDLENEENLDNLGVSSHTVSKAGGNIDYKYVTPTCSMTTSKRPSVGQVVGQWDGPKEENFNAGAGNTQHQVDIKN